MYTDCSGCLEIRLQLIIFPKKSQKSNNDEVMTRKEMGLLVFSKNRVF